LFFERFLIKITTFTSISNIKKSWICIAQVRALGNRVKKLSCKASSVLCSADWRWWPYQGYVTRYTGRFVSTIYHAWFEQNWSKLSLYDSYLHAKMTLIPFSSLTSLVKLFVWTWMCNQQLIGFKKRDITLWTKLQLFEYNLDLTRYPICHYIKRVKGKRYGQTLGFMHIQC
jgi:hypothetical protein